MENHRRYFALPLLSILALLPAAWGADTIVTQRISALNRLIPLQKITVGPDDQYQGTVDFTGQTLIYTRKSDLVPHLRAQDLASGDARDFLPLTADSQEGAISPDGLVAFTYYKFNARGDICYKNVKTPVDGKINCLKNNGGEQSSPFWKSAKELAYVVRDLRTLSSRIAVQNIDTGEQSTLAEGKLWSPAMKAGGRYLVYNELVSAPQEGQTRVLVLKDLQTSQIRVLRFELPGISGFPSVSDDEKTLFFSHYLNDTNDDGVIDGNDNSVVFRVSIESLLARAEVFPEQLTSVETNCSFPRAFQNQLYVTCAFEGALDVYRLPLSGVVPSQWNEALLQNAHQTSRTYEERILILNTLKFRYPKTATSALEERILSNHLLADDFSAGRYFLKRLQAQALPAQKSFYQLLQLYLQARELKKLQPSDEVSREFQSAMSEKDGEIAKIPGHDRFKNILRGLLRTFTRQPSESLGFIKRVHFDATTQPLERGYFFELASWTLPRVKAQGDLLEVYRQMMSAPELTEESQIYYTFQFLSYAQTVSHTMAERMAMIEKMATGLQGPVASLVQSEAATLKIIQAKDDAGKDAAYRGLDQGMSSSRADYSLRKALYIRAILNFADAAEFKYLNFVAVNWLRYTNQEDTEFASAREVYATATLDRAYDTFAQKKYDLAGNYFYGSLSLTDDLESHSGYLRTMVLKNQRTTIDERYQNLQSRQFIGDNLKFVEALLILIDAQPKSRDDVKHYDLAIAKLRAMDQDRDSPVRYLLLGYCTLEKLLRLANGYEFDRELLDSTHRNLMLAYDLGRDNARIRAAALLNLGILHERVQNPGLAVKFFAKRKALGFVSDDEAERFAWYSSRALFYNQQADKASDELGEILAKRPQELPLLERRAFYLQAAEKYAEAVPAYAKLIASHRVQGDLNLAKVYLGYGFSLLKAKKSKEAQQALRQSVDYASHLQVLPKGGDRLVDFEPLRLKLNAYGLLAKIGTSAERLEALEKRSELLPASKKLYDDELSLAIQNRLQMAMLYQNSDPQRAVEKMRGARELADELGHSIGYLSAAVFQSAKDQLVFGVRYPQLIEASERAHIKKLVDQCLQAYDAQKQPQPALEAQKAKLQKLWQKFAAN